MFVEKSELTNAAKLFKIKFNNTRGKRLWFWLVIAILFLGNIISALALVFKHTNQVAAIHLQDYSIFFIVGLPIIFTIIMYLYRESNKRYSVYPQTNTSRFLTEQATYYIMIIGAVVLMLVMNLIQYAVFAVISAISPNVVLIYKFSPVFLIAGFFITIVYMAVITSIIALIAALIRKFNVYAILCLIIVVAIIIINIPKLNSLYGRIFGFLIFEKSPLIFILKGLILWLIFFVIAFIINKNTIYYKSGIKTLKTVFIAIVTLGIAALYAPAFLFIVSEEQHKQPVFEQYDGYSYVINSQEIVLDVSGIPAGSKINIIPTNINVVSESGSYESDEGKMYLSVDNELQYISDFIGKKLIITYTMPHIMNDYVDLNLFTDQQLAAKLEGNTLYLDYQYTTNIKAVYITPWSFMTQFETFKGKNIMPEFLGSANGGGGGNIYITVE
ncbi:MAG: hypothetical protein LBI03_01965 [Clostridiales bacterium]|jgi:hypothetical protein|nr:hypothetical protein [Clostridiales bacterium]